MAEILLKTYKQHNFFKHTFCEFQQVDNFDFPEKTLFKSKSDSMYFYTEEGVFRKSNHWGRVANCRWKLIANKNYKNQQTVIAFAKWTDFYPINSSKRIFYIAVNFDEKTAIIQPRSEKNTHYLFSFSDAQKRVKQIHYVFKDDKWAKYFDIALADLQFQVISEFVNSDKTLQEIKREIS